MNNKTFVGIDIGSYATKAVVIDSSGSILGKAVHKTGIHMTSMAEDVFHEAITNANSEDEPIFVVSTGYGRKNIPFANIDITEITCTARAVYQIFPGRSTAVDIGGQDNKVIFLAENGSIREFKLNRKCAAGTGAFLDEIAWKLEVSPEEMESKARRGEMHKPLNSYCSVFASTEVLEQIRQGETLENMLISVYHSIVRRIIDMAKMEGPLVMSGGTIQYHPIIGEILRDSYKFNVVVPENPQILPAFGAAILARDLYLKNAKEDQRPPLNVVIQDTTV